MTRPPSTQQCISYPTPQKILPPAAWIRASSARWPARNWKNWIYKIARTQIVVLPHVELCPEGAVIDAAPGTSLCDALLENDIDIEHACEKSCACTTCHVIVREGFNALEPSEELEDDLLDKAWGLEPHSRLSCQVILNETPLVVEIPQYTINMAKEGHTKK